MPCMTIFFLSDFGSGMRMDFATNMVARNSSAMYPMAAQRLSSPSMGSKIKTAVTPATTASTILIQNNWSSLRFLS